MPMPSDIPMPNEEETEKMIGQLLNYFDPLNDEMDRRLFYEVTGFQFIENEFDNENSSDDETRKLRGQDPQHHVFNYGDVEQMDDDDYSVGSFDGDRMERED